MEGYGSGHVTVLLTSSAAGRIFPPIIIVQARDFDSFMENLPIGWYKYFTYESSIYYYLFNSTRTLQQTESGFSTSAITESYVEHFGSTAVTSALLDEPEGQKALLIMDNASIHMPLG